MTPTALLQARCLTFGYHSDHVILDRWDADFDAGEVVAVTGPSGCGKSTLLYLLGLMLRPRDGRVLVGGLSAADGSDVVRAHLRATTFGFVFQDAALDATRSILDNITETSLYRGESRAAARRRAVELMEQFGVGLRAGHRPGQISGGQAQRVALCRAMLNDPRILLADEPTGNLDPASSQVVVDALHATAERGGSVVIATHDPVLVARCTREIQL